MCKSFGTSKAKLAYQLYETGAHKALCDMSIDHASYLDADEFKKDLLIVSFLSKYKGLNTGVDLESAALLKFQTSEMQCSQTNSNLSSNEYLDQSIAFDASQIISKILGRFSVEKVQAECGWGPGATFELNRKQALIDHKVSELPLTVTPHALPFFRDVLRNDLHWSCVVLGIKPEELASNEFCFLEDKIFKLVEGCRITTVPKNAKSDRVIAIEPRGNGFLQKGVGAFIRRRLKHLVSIDLNDQSNNQRAACRAYDHALATIDLSMASDTVAKEVIFNLLPADWAIYLDHIRSKSFILPNSTEPTRFEKFSSMGNGFTFELETLIFYAITKAVETRTSRRGESVLVYGDDIICPRESADRVIENLQRFGFTTNVDKTFIKGFYYESCGRHYFKGVEVTPIYQKEEINDVCEHIRLGNRIIRCASRYSCDGVHLYGGLSSAWAAARRTYRGPDVYLPFGAEGDDGWVLPSAYYPERRTTDVNLGLRARVIRFKTKKLPAHESALLAWSLRRGVVTQVPYNGDLERPLTISDDSLQLGYRWFMPTCEFVRAWT